MFMDQDSPGSASGSVISGSFSTKSSNMFRMIALTTCTYATSAASLQLLITKSTAVIPFRIVLTFLISNVFRRSRTILHVVRSPKSQVSQHDQSSPTIEVSLVDDVRSACQSTGLSNRPTKSTSLTDHVMLVYTTVVIGCQ